MTDPTHPQNATLTSDRRIGYIRIDPGDTDISRQALLLDGVGHFAHLIVEQPASQAGVAIVWEKRDRLLNALAAGDVVYTASADRIAAGCRDLDQVAAQIAAAGGALVLLAEGIDTRTAAGRAALRLVRTLADAESDRASRARRAGIQRARASGRRIGRPPVSVPPNFREICKAWSEGILSGRQAAQAAGLKQTSFYTRARELGYVSPRQRKAQKTPPASDLRD